jgi:major membrane immunogen (membrane-anchored lipoprotein)
MPLTDKESRERIRDLNDAFRKTLDPKLGKMMLTAGVAGLSDDVRATTIQMVATFNAFTADNDPHGEHDFGSFDIADQKFFFKLDYYDRNLEFGSDDPADPAKTMRVLTLMLAEEY